LREKERLGALASRLAEEEKTLSEAKRAWEREKVTEAGRMLDDSRALVERVVRELRSRGGETEAVRSAHRELEEVRGEIAARMRAPEGKAEGGSGVGQTSMCEA
jgi:hypothetical protein